MPKGSESVRVGTAIQYSAPGDRSRCEFASPPPGRWLGQSLGED